LSFAGISQNDNTDIYSALEKINDIQENSRDYIEDADIIQSNTEVLEILREALSNEDSFTENLDSLKYITVINSPDQKLRILTWNVVFDDLSHTFYGFIQYRPNQDKYFSYELKDFYSPEDSLKRKFSSCKEWYGAIYYKLIQKKEGKTTSYTLLGWRGKDASVQQKVIENLKFSRYDLPVFGNKCFRIDRKRLNRVVFEYSIRTQMILRYNEKQKLIVSDHLSPDNPKLQGCFEFYGPDLSYDAFEYKQGNWYFVSDVDPEIAINYKRNQRIEQIKNETNSRNF
jgi:hypothetical protein